VETRLNQLGDVVRARRKALGVGSARDLAARMGVSERTARVIESGERAVSDDTYREVERVLRWKHGSVDAILAGGNAVVDEEADLLHIAAVWPTLDARAQSVLLAVLEVLRRS
jgi:transcriptional regulator with XRE-family HTH domain